MDTIFETHSFSVYDIVTGSNRMNARIFWARLVSGERESLLTQYTKHTFYEIQYALEGDLHILLEKDTTIIVPQGSFLVVPPDTLHQILDSQDSGARFVMAFAIENTDSTILQALTALRTPKVHTLDNADPLPLLLSRNINGSLIEKQSVCALLEVFLLDVLSTASKVSSEIKESLGHNESAEQRVAQICAYIQSCNGIQVSVEEIARKFSISPRHLNRLVQSTTGRTPREVINHEKLTKIEEYLVSTDLSISEIAGLCGFCDVYAMNKFFKRYTKSNPSDFRRLAKKK